MVDRPERHRTEEFALTRLLYSQTNATSDGRIASNCARQLGRIGRGCEAEAIRASISAIDLVRRRQGGCYIFRRSVLGARFRSQRRAATLSLTHFVVQAT
ncbi:hypothetical protein [Oscillatoria nigro-viridis]|uniref:hypothetical protein n=1 Tax=Phormidium nigroviride TaxID=482564 RepID=UPI0012375498